MSVTMRDCITQVRERLNEMGQPGYEWAIEGRWRNATLRRWINEACRDIARRTHYLKTTTTLPLTINVSEYSLGTDTLMVYQTYYQPGDGRRIPLNPRSYNSLDQVWGSRQEQHIAQPVFFTTFGKSPLMKIRLYPVVPVSGASLYLYIARLPATINEAGTQDTTSIELPEAWVDLAVTYCEYQARRSDKQPDWQEAKTLYEQTLDLLDTTNDMNAFEDFQMDNLAGVPWWLAAPEGYYF